MRFLIDQQSYEEMLSRDDHTPDCYVRGKEYLHHLYVDGVKYVVARALVACLKEAHAKRDIEAMRHLQLHKEQLDQLAAKAQQQGTLGTTRMLGDPPPTDGHGPPQRQHLGPPRTSNL